MTGLRRGEVARRCGVHVETIRYYEDRGLLPKPRRTAANYRLYDEDSVQRVRFVKRAQELGFTLAEIKELFSLRASGTARCADVYQRAEKRVREIDAKIRALRVMRRAHSELMSQCSDRRSISECPVLDAFESETKGLRR